MDVTSGNNNNNVSSADSGYAAGSSSSATAPASAAAPKDDPRVEFIRRLIVRTFPAVKIDKLSQKLASEAVAPLLFAFLHLADARLLLVTDHGNDTSGSVEVYAVPPPRLFSRAPDTCVLYFVKTAKAPVSFDRVHEEILSGTLERNALESLALLLHEVLIPLIGNAQNQRAWPEIVTTSVIHNVHGFFSSLQITVGQTRGATCLPLPWDQILTEHAAGSALLSSSFAAAGAGATSASIGSSGSHNSSHATASSTLLSVSGGTGTNMGSVGVKDQVHGLENCLITWTKQIYSNIS